jgi:hypothetical protein
MVADADNRTTPAQRQALVEALQKVELAETLIDRVLTHEGERRALLEEAEGLASVRAELRIASELIRKRLALQ